MLIGFLIRDEGDWSDWCAALAKSQGRGSIIHISERERDLAGSLTGEREAAIDEVETLDTTEDEL